MHRNLRNAYKCINICDCYLLSVQCWVFCSSLILNLTGQLENNFIEYHQVSMVNLFLLIHFFYYVHLILETRIKHFRIDCNCQRALINFAYISFFSHSLNSVLLFFSSKLILRLLLYFMLTFSSPKNIYVSISF